jgi:PTS system N-acetylgalactosamine-specific IIB component
VREYLLARIDDRLLHGQVALGWRHALGPDAFLIVDDAVANDPLAIHLFDAALPEGMRLVILDTARFLELREPSTEPSRTILLIRELSILEGLCARGFRPREVNIGGIHHRAGAQRCLDYVYLTDDDRAALRRLIDLGIVLYAQDLPSSPRKSVEELLATGGRP